MNYHAVFAKGKEIIVGRKALPKTKKNISKYKEPSTLCRQGHHSYPVEPLPNLNEEESLKLTRKK